VRGISGDELLKRPGPDVDCHAIEEGEEREENSTSDRIIYMYFLLCLIAQLRLRPPYC
jgi:hypothetical protein